MTVVYNKFMTIKKKLLYELIQELDIDIIKDYFYVIGFECSHRCINICICMHLTNYVAYICYNRSNPVEPIKINSMSQVASDLLYTDPCISTRLLEWINRIKQRKQVFSLYVKMCQAHKHLISSFLFEYFDRLQNKFPNHDKFINHDLVCINVSYMTDDLSECLLQLKNSNVTIDIINHTQKSIGIRTRYKLIGHDFESFHNQDSKEIIKVLGVFCLRIDLYDPMKHILASL